MSAALTIRLATKPELDRIAQIWDDSWRSTRVPSPETLSISQLKDRLIEFVASGAEIYAIERARDLIGMMVLEPDDQKLSQLFMAPAFQGQGFGSECLTYVKSKLPGGFTLTVAEANHNARAFYTAAGLIREARIFRSDYSRYDLQFRWAP